MPTYDGPAEITLPEGSTAQVRASLRSSRSAGGRESFAGTITFASADVSAQNAAYRASQPLPIRLPDGQTGFVVARNNPIPGHPMQVDGSGDAPF